MKDLTFNNPLNRSLRADNDDKNTVSRTLETARLLIRHILDCE